MYKKLFRIRRILLKVLVPEFIWPKFIKFDGISIPVRGMNFSFGVKRILTLGTYEKSEREIICNSIRDEDIVVEMGSSIGVVTSVILNKIGKNGKLISIEADSELVKISKSWVKNYDNLKIVQGYGFPVTNLPDKYIRVNFNSDGNSLGGIVSIDDSYNENKLVYDLNRIKDEFDISPNKLVIDIEGSEIVLLEDKILIPQSVVTIIIELHPHIYGQDKKNLLIQKILSFGFIQKRTIEDVFLFLRKSDFKNSI